MARVRFKLGFTISVIAPVVGLRVTNPGKLFSKSMMNCGLTKDAIDRRSMCQKSVLNVSAPIHFGSRGCQRTENFGFCALYCECCAFRTVVAEVFWLYHSSRSAISNSRLYATGKFHVGLVIGIRSS